MKLITGFLVCLVMLVVGAAVVLYTGTYNVAATEPHTPLARWVLEAGKHRSVQARANQIEVPGQFTDTQVLQGFRRFREVCIACHGAPGIERSEVGLGLRPQPPRLENVVTAWETEELFWIVKHGIRMTGMPAWGPTHSDEEIWAIVAFVQKLPAISADEYRRMESGMAGSRPER